jgi:hypothetical protein
VPVHTHKHAETLYEARAFLHPYHHTFCTMPRVSKDARSHTRNAAHPACRGAPRGAPGRAGRRRRACPEPGGSRHRERRRCDRDSLVQTSMRQCSNIQMAMFRSLALKGQPYTRRIACYIICDINTIPEWCIYPTTHRGWFL